MVVVPRQALSLMPGRGKRLAPHFTDVQHPAWKANKPPGLAADREPAPPGLAETTGPHGCAETEQAPVGLLGWKPFSVPHFLSGGNGLQPP